MNMVNNPLNSLRPLTGAVQSLGVEPKTRRHPAEEHPPAVPFVTISRQAGAGGMSLAHRLVERLNQGDPKGIPWRAYDRELVEKVVADQPRFQQLVESLGEVRHSWLDDLIGGLATSAGESELSELTAYRYVAKTIRALAQGGRVVVVGRGGVYITRGMPGGLHLRLVGPLEFRIAEYARKFNLSRAAAAKRVRELDRNREAFHRRYGGGDALTAEVFSITFNTAHISEQAIVECLVPLLRTPTPSAGSPAFIYQSSP